MRRIVPIALLLLLIAGIGTAFHIMNLAAASHANAAITTTRTTTVAFTAPKPYLYYTLKQSTGFVLARAPKGTDGQPLGNLQTVAAFPNEFVLAGADSVFFMQLSPDGRYLAIDGSGDHGEQVWV
ncbi:MAG: hypothetical protein M3Z24_11350, partial [Chloroflexota bacterium]|nr:hypothetical protein [Chloroflexota bacterium]